MHFLFSADVDSAVLASFASLSLFNMKLSPLSTSLEFCHLPNSNCHRPPTPMRCSLSIRFKLLLDSHFCLLDILLHSGRLGIFKFISPVAGSMQTRSARDAFTPRRGAFGGPVLPVLAVTRLHPSPLLVDSLMGVLEVQGATGAFFQASSSSDGQGFLFSRGHQVVSVQPVQPAPPTQPPCGFVCRDGAPSGRCSRASTLRQRMAVPYAFTAFFTACIVGTNPPPPLSKPQPTTTTPSTVDPQTAAVSTNV